MTHQTDVLEQLSTALAERAVSARGSVVAIRLPGDRHLTGTLWRPDVVVASEQSLPKGAEFELRVAGRSSQARFVGRDPGTNLALLRLAEPTPAPAFGTARAQAGALALAFGANARGDVTARTGVVNRVGPEWHSSAGGRIDARIVLDMQISRSEEGGPVLDAIGNCLGVTAFGPRGQVLVIPAATLERTVPALLEHGRISRGWLGVALHPVAVPDALQEQAGQTSGQMVMSIVEGGPAAKAGIVAGDIVLTLNGAPARRLRAIATHLGSESVGRKAALRLIRGGAVLSLEVTIEARPAA